MARRIVHQLVDDLDGEVLETGAGETITFSLNGVSYELDLSEKNAAEFREKLDPWISAARRVASSGTGRARDSRRSSTGSRPKRDLAAIRVWANAHGHKVSDRGRVPETVLQAYDAAH
ncbi:histone-like nucleoid-structuring protein Lsr2 [Microbacterium murale]|nr:Lsr2 family protein [Microbacterium murale]